MEPVLIRQPPGPRPPSNRLGERGDGGRFCRSAILFLLGVFFLARPLDPTAAEFSPEERITSDTSRNYQTSRNPNHSLAVDSSGTVHLVFWHGRLATTPETPSGVWYCNRAAGKGWSIPEEIDNSFTSGALKLGGRHPALILRPDGSLFVFWHDYRNCRERQRWIDNVEIYMDVRSPDGLFSDSDIRLTITETAQSGDNGYLPQAVQAPDGEVFLAWYDFHFNADVADVFMTKSDSLGLFDPSETMSQRRLTNAGDRGNAPSYGLPDLAFDSIGRIHLVWTIGTAGTTASPGVYYARWHEGTLSPPVLLSQSGADYYDPPRITTAPNGDIFALWKQHGGSGRGKDIFVARLRSGQDVFDAAVPVSTDSANQFEGDLEVDANGLLHIVWVDERSGSQNICYGVFDPNSNTLQSETTLTETSSDCRKPTIALDRNGFVYVVWTDYRHGEGQIYFRTNRGPARAGPKWSLYR